MDARLAEWAAALERDGWAASMLDAEQRIVWVSSEMQKFLNESDEEQLGYGRNVAAALLSETWRKTITPDTQIELVKTVLPHMAPDSPSSLVSDELPPQLRDAVRAAVESTDRAPLPPLITGTFGYSDRGEPAYPVRYLVASLRSPDGTLIGSVIVTDMAAPATLISLLAQGDAEMHQRMAELVEPGRHAAAIVFADLPDSGDLARRLPSAVYFGLIQQLTQTFDELVGRNGGVVGKHVGDGMTAFFLSIQTGGDSEAAAAALRTVAALQKAAPEIFERCVDDGVVSDGAIGRFNVGLHWGGNLYVGQLVPRSRLEVTALGDEVNECARIQESARRGTVLASKQFVELVDRECLGQCSIEPSALLYEPIAGLETATEKAIRDAGTIAVTTLFV